MPNDFTTWIALYGACLSTTVAIVGAGWAIYNHRNNQPKLTIEARLVRNLNGEKIRMTITNVRQRRNTIRSFQYKADSTPDFLTLTRWGTEEFSNLQYSIEESQVLVNYIPPGLMVAPDNIEYLAVRDAHGITHKSSRFPVKGQRFEAE